MDSFDLDRYLRASKKVDLEGVRWDDISRYPLSEAEARTLTYMMDIESHTVVYLRDLLATRAVYDPDVTAFLSCWVYEELWHGEALSRFLGEAGYRPGSEDEIPTAVTPYPSREARNNGIRRRTALKSSVGHVATMVASSVIKDFVALHMTWGAINELSTLTGYQRLIVTTENPVLVDLLRRIIKDERRHYAFYRAQARMRLARTPRARSITRWAIDHFWAPVGTGVRPKAETDFVVSYLFGGPEGARAAAEMDAQIRELPGFDDVSIIADAREKALRRAGPVVAPAPHVPALRSA